MFCLQDKESEAVELKQQVSELKAANKELHVQCEKTKVRLFLRSVVIAPCMTVRCSQCDVPASFHDQVAVMEVSYTMPSAQHQQRRPDAGSIIQYIP